MTQLQLCNSETLKLCHLTALVEHGEEFSDKIFIPETGLRLLAHGDGGLVMRERRLVRTGSAQRIVNVDHLQNARQEGNVAIFEAVGIAAAVGMLVMVTNDGQDQAQGL